MLNQSHIVYVLRSVNHPDRYYTGLTDNVERRLAVHNSGGSQHTAQLRPWRLVACTHFADPVSGAAFEQYLKTGSGARSQSVTSCDPEALDSGDRTGGAGGRGPTSDAGMVTG